MVSDQPKTESAIDQVESSSLSALDPAKDYWVIGPGEIFFALVPGAKLEPNLAWECSFPQCICERLDVAIEQAKDYSKRWPEPCYIWHWPEPANAKPAAIGIACEGSLYMRGEWESAIADWAIDQAVKATEPSIQAAIDDVIYPTNPLRSAFPWVAPGEGGPGDFVMEPGLTKREFFAAMAMQGHLAGGDYWEPAHLAEASLEKADALLTELAK